MVRLAFHSVGLTEKLFIFMRVDFVSHMDSPTSYSAGQWVIGCDGFGSRITVEHIGWRAVGQ